MGERTVTRNWISHSFESKPKTTVWRERKELVKDLTVLFPAFSSLALIALKTSVTSCGCERKYAMFSDDWVVYSKGTIGEECLAASSGLKCCTRSQKEIDLKDVVNGFITLVVYPAELLLLTALKSRSVLMVFLFSLHNLLVFSIDTHFYFYWKNTRGRLMICFSQVLMIWNHKCFGASRFSLCKPSNFWDVGLEHEWHFL